MSKDLGLLGKISPKTPITLCWCYGQCHHAWFSYQGRSNWCHFEWRNYSHTYVALSTRMECCRSLYTLVTLRFWIIIFMIFYQIVFIGCFKVHPFLFWCHGLLHGNVFGPHNTSKLKELNYDTLCVEHVLSIPSTFDGDFFWNSPNW